MRIAGEDRIVQFARNYPNTRSALNRWVSVVEAADWKSPADMKKTFRSADLVGDQVVFNAGGNKCRLIALLHYRSRYGLVQQVLTHPEYDQGDWKQ